MIKNIFLCLFAFTLTIFSFAQDYPYDDAEKGDLPVESPESLSPGQPKQTISNRDQENLIRKRRHQIETGMVRNKNEASSSLTRMGLKFGGNYTIFQNPGKTSLYDGGYEVVASVGWDLAYQSVFLEFESGYKRYFMTNSSALHIIPTRFGTFYRNRIGDTTLWKLGTGPGMDVRIVRLSYSNDLDGGFFPTFFVSNMFEFGSLIFEIVANFHRLHNADNFMSFSGRFGFRF